MTKMRKTKSIATFILALAVLVGAMPVYTNAAEVASNIRLEKTQGTVSVKNAANRSQTVHNDMRILNGYKVSTSKASYAWMMLDSSKAGKLDANSEARIRSRGKNLEILVSAGKMLFNVTKKLDADESMKIRTSTIVTGVRGTIVWVDEVEDGYTQVGVLDGSVQCQTTDSKKSFKVEAGEIAEVHTTEGTSSGTSGETTVENREMTIDDVSPMILVEVAENHEMGEKIAEATDNRIDLTDITVEEAEEKIKEEEKVTEEKIAETEAAVKEQEEASSQENVFMEESGESSSSDEGSSTSGGGGGSSSGGGGGSTTPPDSQNTPSSDPGTTYLTEEYFAFGNSDPNSLYTVSATGVTTPDAYGGYVTKGHTVTFTITLTGSCYAGSDYKASLMCYLAGSSDSPQERPLTPTSQSGNVYIYSYDFPLDNVESYILNVTGIYQNESWVDFRFEQGGNVTPSATPQYSLTTDNSADIQEPTSGNYMIRPGISYSYTATYTLSSGNNLCLISAEMNKVKTNETLSGENITKTTTGTFIPSVPTSGAYTISTGLFEINSSQAYGASKGDTMNIYASPASIEAGSDFDSIDMWSNVVYSSKKTGYTAVNIAESINGSMLCYDSGTNIWFNGFSGLESITGMENLNTSGISSFAWMFGGCSSLESVDLSHLDTASVTSTANMFNSCTSMTAINIRSFGTGSNITNISSMFNSCSKLSAIYVSSDFVSRIQSASSSTNVFDSCTLLVGGAGTKYADRPQETSNAMFAGNVVYARIDEGPTSANPGYFTS